MTESKEMTEIDGFYSLMYPSKLERQNRLPPEERDLIEERVFRISLLPPGLLEEVYKEWYPGIKEDLLEKCELKAKDLKSKETSTQVSLESRIQLPSFMEIIMENLVNTIFAVFTITKEAVIYRVKGIWRK